MEAAHNRLNILILDACRNNPFARSFRSGTNGLASQDAPTGTLIAYATQPGNVASDGTRRNGLYTQELLVALRTPGRKVEDVFKQVREQVLKKSGHTQTPWEHSSLVGDFYFLPSSNAGAVEVKPALLPLPAPTVPATAPTSTPTQNPTQSGQKTFPFLASSGWVESGITVQPGQQVKITITYSGVNLGKFGPTGPAGVLQQDENRPLKSCPTGAPLARVGAGNAPPICLANTPTFTAQQAGKLFFGLNESNYKDNAGTVIAKIELVP